MGNASTVEEADTLACQFIFSLDFETLSYFHDPEVCQQIVLIIKDILQRNLTMMEIQSLANRVTNHDDIIFEDEGKKKTYCEKIARFYVTIANLFAMLVATIWPVTADGKRWSQAEAEAEAEAEERIFPEIESLYFDEYNLDTDEFHGMSSAAQEEYQDDLRTFYEMFIGNQQQQKMAKSRPSKFANIVIPQEISQGVNVASSNQENIFGMYATHVRQMLEKALAKHQELKDILNILFLAEKKGNTYLVRVHPDLNEGILKRALTKTRRAIADLYTNCAKDYNESSALLETLIETKVQSSTLRQIQALEKLREELIQENLEKEEKEKETAIKKIEFDFDSDSEI